MNEKILEQLDYNRIKKDIARNCVSQEGKNRLENALPLSDENEIKKLKALSCEWMYLHKYTRSVRLLPWNCIDEALKILAVSGSCLTLEEAFSLSRFSQAVGALLSTFEVGSDYEKSCPSIFDQVRSMYDLSEAQQKIDYLIDKNGEIREVPQIRSIKKEIRKKQGEIESVMKKYTTSSDFQDCLQSALPVLRSGRQVLAVKSGSRNRIKGIVHEVSQTGNTLYVEPAEIVQISNELLEIEADLLRQIKLLMQDLTSELAHYIDEFRHNQYVLALLDFCSASSLWGIEHKGCYAQDVDFAEGENLSLKKARHPVLEEKLGSKAVPIDVVLEKSTRVLIISGANTGGKTVTLKTIALFALLNQSGFPLPCEEAALPVFSEVFADIGDEQSMDESLSTFSAHMKNVALALENADENSLVLLDELGSGTDPLEGGAVAMAVLDELIARGSFVILTTHHGAIKNYGYTHPNCLNASVEFSSENLSPTYKILMGVPGSSHAIEIAGRSGISHAVIDKAKSYINTNQADVATLIQGLTEKYAEAEKIRSELVSKEEKINEKWRKVDLKNLQVKQHELELREQGYRESRRFLEESRRELENLVRELKEAGNAEGINRDLTVKVKSTIENLSESVKKEEKALEQEKDKISDKNDTSDNGREFAVGDNVKFGPKKIRGVIVKKEKNGKYQIQTETLRLTVPATEISRVGEEHPVSSAVGYSFVGGSEKNAGTSSECASEKPAFELRLLGMRYEEAMKALEKQLDLCCINDFKHFSVIHGKGDGILQKAVWDFLKNFPYVEKMYFARPEDGGSGKTYVDLK